MKQFDLESFLKNPTRPIVTRDGRSVRIICTDRVCSTYPILALLFDGKDREVVYQYTSKGEYYPNVIGPHDLFFAPEPKAKKKGWMNVCKFGDSKHFTLVGGVIHPTREAALKETPDYVVDTIQIRWEE